MRIRVDIIDGRKFPISGVPQKKSVVAQMVVRIADTNIENYAGPHFTQVNGDIVACNKFGKLDIACTVGSSRAVGISQYNRYRRRQKFLFRCSLFFLLWGAFLYDKSDILNFSAKNIIFCEQKKIIFKPEHKEHLQITAYCDSRRAFFNQKSENTKFPLVRKAFACQAACANGQALYSRPPSLKSEPNAGNILCSPS